MRPLSSVNFSHFILLRNHNTTGTKLGKNVLCNVYIFSDQKSTTETRGPTVPIYSFSIFMKHSNIFGMTLTFYRYNGATQALDICVLLRLIVSLFVFFFLLAIELSAFRITASVLFKLHDSSQKFFSDWNSTAHPVTRYAQCNGRTNRVMHLLHLIWEKFEYTKGVIRSHESKNSQYNDQAKKEGQPTIYKILHRKLNIEEHEPH